MINSPADKMLDCATLVQSHNQNTISFATGFFFTFNIDGNAVPVLISNRHVLEFPQAIQIHLRVSNFQSRDEQLNSYHRVEVNMNIEGSVFLHPNPEIDLALVPLAGLMRQCESQNEYIANFFIPESSLLAEEEFRSLTAIENLIMIGCPEGHYDYFNHLPLIRRGITASHPTYDYNGKPVFLSDIACFPGSSGSPIFLYNPFGYADYQTQTYRFGESRIKLIGIQSAGYLKPDTQQFINLAIAQKAYLLKDFKSLLQNYL